MCEADIVFLDPDNGLLVKSVRRGSYKSTKYCFPEEIADYLSLGKSVVFYNHRQRKKYENYVLGIYDTLFSMDEIKGKHIDILTFPFYSIRDYFIISENEMHQQKIEKAIAKVCQRKTRKNEMLCVRNII